jgi:uncharacterized membrane protein
VRLWRDRRDWRRWAQVVAAACVVTAASYWLFPEAPIFFGILHCIAAASLIGVPFVEAPVAATLLAAALAFSAPLLFAAPVFDAKVFWWTGLSTFTPASNDYRPLLPWLGFVLLGVAAAARRPSSGASRHLRPQGEKEDTPAGRSEAGRAPLAFLGRHSLAFYLIHQPILFGALALIGPQAAPVDEAAFTAKCVDQCVASGAGGARCQASCVCFIDRAKAAGRWTALTAGGLSEAQKTATREDAAACYAESER